MGYGLSEIPLEGELVENEKRLAYPLKAFRDLRGSARLLLKSHSQPGRVNGLFCARKNFLLFCKLGVYTTVKFLYSYLIGSGRAINQREIEMNELQQIKSARTKVQQKLDSAAKRRCYLQINSESLETDPETGYLCPNRIERLQGLVDKLYRREAECMSLLNQLRVA